MSSPSPTPTYAKISSLSHWTTFFHPTSGIFRLSANQGESIEHLDIDLRFVEHEYDNSAAKGLEELSFDRKINLPRVVKLTLRGGEYVQDDETRMDALAEVLLAISPVEVHWINAATDPSEQLTFATHLVHPAVIAAGENWSRNGTLRKLIVQGGFPCPNLTAPTPFSLTPAATPCPSPGPARGTFGSLSMSRPTSPAHPSGKFPNSLSSGLPALSTTKPKPADEEKLKAREERRRLADYTLKPRFEYAFGSWTVEDLRWRLDGRYTPACIVSIITHLIRAVDASFPSASRKFDIELPSAITFTSVPKGIIDELSALPDKLEVDADVQKYLHDVVFIALERSSCPAARLWVRKDSLGVPPQGVEFGSPASSDGSILPGVTEGPSEDEREAITPEMGSSMLVDPSDFVARENSKGEKVGNPTMAESIEL
ncbi:hypothetical protein I316_05352 [Kwoniella heveanensis BCC8398]|uniref:Uncharacterized protein n=1 Tax=Kwoniella heveanensis BCC8398 TaxID=1296120 RepID=A0A1B9GPI5_9TREE|nr:hypothetical protein I316_05352 [Kwoniella heveanensis BCC8398]